MIGPHRIGAEEVRRKQLSGEPLLLVGVCARSWYDCLHLDRAIPMEELESRCMGKGHEIVFYGEGGEAEKAASDYYNRGYVNAKILEGGVEAWKRAGYPLTLGT